MTKLTVNNLSCIKKDRLLFKDINCQVHAGEVLYVRGPNGAGKTSFLRLLAGLSVPESGTITWNNKSISDCQDEYHMALNYCGHKLGLNAVLSVFENLHYWCLQQGLANQFDIFGILEQLELVDTEHLPVGQLSAGQQRRVALAKLWLKPASLWILDEPFTSLDKTGIELLQQKVAEHLLQKGLVVMTSHQLVEFESPVSELLLEFTW